MKFEPKKGWLGGKEIPLNSSGDPEFTRMDDQGSGYIGVQQVFSNEEIVYLVNKALYGLFYQREHHKKRAAAEREALAPVKAKIKELYGVSYLKATDEQLSSAIEAVKEEQKDGD